MCIKYKLPDRSNKGQWIEVAILLMKCARPQHLQPSRLKVSLPKLECPIHKEDVIKVCTRVRCKNKRFVCITCMACASQKKHLVDHFPFFSLDEVVQADIPPDVEQKMSQFQKYFKRAKDLIRQSHTQVSSIFQEALKTTAGLLRVTGPVQVGALDCIWDATRANRDCIPLITQSSIVQIDNLLQTGNGDTCLGKEERSDLRFRLVVVQLLSYIQNTVKKRLTSAILDQRQKNSIVQKIKRLGRVDFNVEEDLRRENKNPLEDTMAFVNVSTLSTSTLQRVATILRTNSLGGLTLLLPGSSILQLQKLRLPAQCPQIVFHLNGWPVSHKIIQQLVIVTMESQGYQSGSPTGKNTVDKLTVLCFKCLINNDMLQDISKWVSLFHNVKVLKLNFRCNRVSSIGIYYLIQGIQKLRRLTSLSLDFGGFGSEQNDLEGSLGIIGATLLELQDLRSVVLEVANTNIQDADLFQLTCCLMECQKLQQLVLGLELNKDLKGLVDLVQKLSFTKLIMLTLCLDGLDVRMSDLVYMIQCINYSEYLVEASISAKNCNLFENKTTSRRTVSSPRVKIKLNY